MTEKLTVILPTRDRAETLKYSLQTVISQDNPNLEIIVSDNFSGPDVKAVVDEVNDERLCYIRTSERMGMSEHWDFALEHATGDWITFLGDDDGLLPNAVNDFFELKNKHSTIKAIRYVNCTFDWPTDKGSALKVVYGSGQEIRSCKSFLKRVLSGEVNLIPELPNIYTGGFVHKSIIAKGKAKAVNKKFFASITPDFYSSMAICALEEDYLFSFEPATVNGASKHSNGRQHLKKSQEEMMKLDFHLENGIPFHKKLGLPPTESMQILAYEAFLQARDLLGSDLDIKLVDQLAIAIANSKKRAKKSTIEYCEQVAEKNEIDFSEVKQRTKAHFFKIKLRKKLSKIKGLVGFSKAKSIVVRDNNISDIFKACEKTNEILNKPF